MTIWLTDQETAAAASWSAKIDAIGQALLDCDAGDALSGPRVDYHVVPESPDEAGSGRDQLLDFRSMFGLWPARGIAALRVANHTYSFTRTPSSTVATRAVLDGERIPAFVLVFDARTGRPLAILPDGNLQRDRVVATAAVGARVLARPDSRSIGLVGTGHMAEGYVAALRSVLPLEKLLVFSPTREHAAAFAAAVEAEHALEVTVVESVEQAAQADVVCAATNSREPVLHGRWLRPGTHVITTNLREPDPSVVDAADVALVTCRDRDDGWRLEGAALPAQRERIRELLGGDWGTSSTSRPGLRLAELDDLSAVLTGRVHGRRSPLDITYHVNQSAGIQFAAIAAAVLDGASRMGLGTHLPDEAFSTAKPRRIVDAATTMEGFRP